MMDVMNYRDVISRLSKCRESRETLNPILTILNELNAGKEGISMNEAYVYLSLACECSPELEQTEYSHIAVYCIG